jgi:RNA polymerase sigma-70 factor (ECF subfamily)
LEPGRGKFIQLVHAHQGIIKSLCRAYFPNAEDQRDLFQDIVLALWKSVESFRGEAAPGTWIYRVSLNTIFSRIRHERRRIPLEPVDVYPEAWHKASADDDAELLGLVLQLLKPVDKALVILYLEGYRNKEIADILDLTPTNVSTRLNRVRSDLKNRFKKSGHHELR